MKDIHIWGVRQNNLKSIEVKIPLGSFTVICGPSGSGKSSLAFETLYAEGQRRYIESLSNYTKQFLNKAPKPDVDGIENIPPAIAIEQKNSVKGSRSTVGTTTEVVDYLRLLYEKIGRAYCPDHHILLSKESPSSGSRRVLSAFNGKRGYVLAAIEENGRTLSGKKLLAYLLQEGYMRIFIPSPSAIEKKPKKVLKAKRKSTKKTLAEIVKNGSKQDELLPYSKDFLGEVILLEDLKKKTLPRQKFYVVIDRLAFTENELGRVTDSLQQAYSASLKFNQNLVSPQALVVTTDNEAMRIDEDFSCSVCGYKLPAITSALFSFNSPVGACETCNGFGNILTVDKDKVIPNPKLSISQGAIKPFAMPSAKTDRRNLISFCRKEGIDTELPWDELSKVDQEMIWQGTESFYGVLGLFEYLERKKYKMHVRVFLARHKSPFPCDSCHGTRLKPAAQQVLVGGQSISDLSTMSIDDLIKFFAKLKISPSEAELVAEVLRQITSRLTFLQNVGVGYLTLDRATKTLSGGEYQRLNLSNQLGAALSQTLYVLDEPTVGLHPRDNDRLILVLKELRELGNTLVVVEHDHDVIKNSSHVIELGPGSGHLGGTILCADITENFMNDPKSVTAPYLKPSKNWVPLRQPRPVNIDASKFTIGIEGAQGNNLKNISVKIPLNRFVTVTGVSGSGKSTLISQTLYPAIARKLGVEFLKSLEYKRVTGLEHVKNVLFIDQSTIGKTARSSPMTYMKCNDAIRTLYASTEEAKSRGYTAGTFSLNVDGGRCPVCKGLGFEVVDMMFMDDIHILCDACNGKRFRDEVLEITYKGKNIFEIMNLTVAEAMDFFVAYPNIRRPLAILHEVGLDYLTLGQPANSLSGGESQRLKLAAEFNTTNQKNTLYILDEPTTGLHFREVHLLIKVLNRLIESGGSVIVIEHNLEVIRNCDYIIDIGPEAGKKGGHLVAFGSPEEVMANKKSYTGIYLKNYIEQMNPSIKRPTQRHVDELR